MDSEILESERNDKMMSFFCCLMSPYSGEIKILRSHTLEVVTGSELDLVSALSGQK